MVKQLFMARIHVTGASGSGTTTLGRALSARLRLPHFDSDEYFWIPTVPRYRIKREKAVRDARIAEDIRAFDGWVWSGSSVNWQHGALDRFSLCVFLTLPSEVRLKRLRRRAEQEHRAIPGVTAEEIPEDVFGLIDRVIAKAGDAYSVHGEVRAPMDHFLNLLGMEDGLMALIDDLTSSVSTAAIAVCSAASGSPEATWPRLPRMSTPALAGSRLASAALSSAATRLSRPRPIDASGAGRI